LDFVAAYWIKDFCIFEVACFFSKILLTPVFMPGFFLCVPHGAQQPGGGLLDELVFGVGVGDHRDIMPAMAAMR
jgi:hypothetical protein